MHRPFCKTITLSLLLLSVGFHFVFLQSVAWTGMFASRIGKMSMKQAITETFDGEHPCELCKVVKKEQKNEQETPISISLKKEVKVWCYENQPTMLALPEMPSSYKIEFSLKEHKLLAHAPPSPPPRMQELFV